MIRFPNAKINLGLNIVRRRDDGYHDIETVFYPIPLNDILEIVPSESGTTTLTITGNKIDCAPEKNLVMKAYNLLATKYKLAPMDIYLHKIIPDGAGLGGGSSDATNTLMSINEITKLGLNNIEIAKFASLLGADCPFFAYNKPLLATGIGNIFTPISFSLSGMHLALIKPNVSIPTALAYSNVTPAESVISLHEILSYPTHEWKKLLKNDFEKSVFATYPQLLDIKQSLYDAGAIYSAMSGSGSSIFGIFESAIMADDLKNHFPLYNCYAMEL
ncbi:MAG: 4-(cytidine 5'-diphospho)-2-C-methyl-D-erythritol kinase [Muribaculaceae bacterium]